MQKLINIVETHCKTKAEISKSMRNEDSQLSESQDKAKPANGESELAQLIIEIYGKKTSVIYDLAAITELMQQNVDQKSGEDSKLKLLSNLLYFSLAKIFQNKDHQCSVKDFQITYNQYWKLALTHLTLKKVNELIQPNRTNYGVVEPLLKALFLVCQS